MRFSQGNGIGSGFAHGRVGASVVSLSGFGDTDEGVPAALEPSKVATKAPMPWVKPLGVLAILAAGCWAWQQYKR